MIFFLNAINLLTVLVGFTVQVLIVRFFGASDSTDVYYLVITVMTFVSGLSTGFLTDLFIPIYHDAKNRRFEDAQKLSGSVLTLSLGSGLLIGLLVYVFSPVVVTLFASGFKEGKMVFATDMLRIISFSIPFATVSVVLNSTLNANSFMITTYLTNLLTPVFNGVALLVAGRTYGVSALMYATVLASILAAGILFVYCKFKVGARFANPLRQRNLRYLLIKNVPVRMTNMANLLRGPITTTVLSYFPAGLLTLYSYADRIITVLLGVANAPLTQVYFVQSSELSARKAFGEIRRLLGSIITTSSLMFAGLFFTTVIVFRVAFNNFFAAKVSVDNVRIMFILFLALFPFSFTSLLGAQITATGLAMKKGRLSLYSAIGFLTVLAIVIVPSVRLLSVFGLPVSLGVAQLSSVLIYSKLLNKVEPLIDFGLLKNQWDTIIIGGVVIAFNFIWNLGPAIQIAVNSLLFAVWIVRNWSEAHDTLRFVTAKGMVK